MKYFIYAVIFAVSAAIVAGFFAIGSPAAQRNIRFDQQRISDLQNIQSQIIYYWQGKQKLPAALDGLIDPTRGVSVPADPENNASYGYNVKGPLEFYLCATFSKTSAGQIGYYPATKTAPPPVGLPYPAESNWSHGAGNVCFDRKIDAAFYPPIK